MTDTHAPQRQGSTQECAHGSVGDHETPKRIGPYRVVRYIGGGGMGDVWLAEDEHGNEVAIKLLSLARLGQKSAVERFMREGRTLSRLQHRNICHIYGIESCAGRHYLVMEYVRGAVLSRLLHYLSAPSSDETTRTSRGSREELSTIIEEVEQSTSAEEDWDAPRPLITTEPSHVLPLQQTLSIVTKLCDAVQYAHERGVFHRDIKPSNVIIRRDGEPVLLDFGVAKLADEVDLTMQGQLFGTMEYMAPEQARSPMEVDERADVYSIGAILYEMCVGQRHFIPSGNNLRDAHRLADHVPIRPRSLNRRIDRELQEIIVKALSPDPVLRYRSARQLGEDLCRYREGKPIAARPPTIGYRLRTFARKHAAALALWSAIAVLGGALGGYYAIDYHRRWGDWKQVYGEDFTDERYDAARLRFEQRDRRPAAPWMVDGNGLAVRATEWCWLDGVSVAADVRVVIRLRFAALPDGVEVIVNSADDTLPVWYALPRGYSCQVGGYAGTLDIVSVNESPGMARMTHTAPSTVAGGEEATLLFQRTGEAVELFVNGRRQVAVNDPTPLWGPPFERIGFRSYAQGVTVQSLDVYRMSLPRHATPLIVGDALLARGFYDDAVTSYLGVAADFSSSPLADQAITSAALAAAEMDGKEAEGMVDSLLSVLEKRFPGSDGWRIVRERQMERRWLQGRYEEALVLLPDHYRYYPDTRIGVALLSMSTRGSVPRGIRETVFGWATRTRDVAALDCSGLPPPVMRHLEGSAVRNLNCGHMGLNDLDAVGGLKLHWLVCDDNRIRTLEPLRGQPLEYLICRKNRLETLEGLEGAPLRTLDAGENRIGNLWPIRSAPITELWLRENRILDLAPLAGMPLRRLFINDNLVRDLSPLRGMQLTTLTCGGNRITDLSPLSGMPLAELDCSGNPVIDLGALHTLPLASLKCDSTGLESLEALRGLPLRHLSCGRNGFTDLEPLRGMPLRSLACPHNAITSLEPLGAPALEYLVVDDNRVTSLEALAGMPLKSLSCRGNPLESFGPFLENPPESFHFISEEIPAELLRRAIRAWSRRPEHHAHLHQARTCLLLNTGRYAELRALGHHFGNNTYLYIPMPLGWEEADSIARLSGGHLVTLSDKEETRFCVGIKDALRPVWLGARNAHGRGVTVTGESPGYLAQFGGRDEGDWVLREEPELWPPRQRCNVVIEWEG